MKGEYWFIERRERQGGANRQLDGDKRCKPQGGRTEGFSRSET